ncbi:putative membrane protein [Mycobacterium liflandii 128FXT]|uniref:Membrane protein n=1 Tax=Mycobacterium liflandii (strain 128FXT) TaxID=459424 RepID=L7V3D4_MYCL1|nr:MULTISPECIES: hypothetical protein [Mycobacterium ulcerans group]AGC60988.1 putative membrane protein [Mycobacterium liflandii 128FXT]
MATLRRYIVIQLMVFVIGIVGPIFLIVFFASPSDPNAKWGFWVGFFIRAPALLISRLVSWVDDLWCRAIGAGV